MAASTDEIDRWVLGRLPWSWCSLPTVYMHMGAHGNESQQAMVREALGRLTVAKKAGIREHALVTMYKRIKEN